MSDAILNFDFRRTGPVRKSEIGERIRAYRQLHNLTLAEFGYLVCACEQSVNKWELGRCNPRPTTLEVIETVLEVEPDKQAARVRRGRNRLLAAYDKATATERHELGRTVRRIEERLAVEKAALECAA